MANLLIESKDRKLLLKSDILNTYPKLKTFLITTPELKDTEIHTLDDDLKKLFESDIHKSIIAESFKEWEVNKSKMLSDDEIEEINNCQICNTPINQKCCIINKFNSNELIIGSTCVTYFGIMDKKELDEILKTREKIKRREEINRAINNVEKIISELNTYLEEIPIIVKKEVIKNFENLKCELNIIYEKYIEEKLDKSEKTKIIDRIKTILVDIDKEKEKINCYVDTYQNHKFVVTRNILRSVSYDDSCRTDLINEGFISERNIFRIRDIGFANSVIGDLNEQLIPYNVKVVSVIDINGQIYYKIALNSRVPITLEYKYYDFMFNYGSIIYKLDPLEEINYKVILENSRIKNEETISTILRCVDEVLNDYEFEIDDFNIDFDKLIVKNNRIEDGKKNMYYILSLTETITKFKGIVIDDYKKYEKGILNHVKSCKDRRNEIEMEKYMQQINI